MPSAVSEQGRLQLRGGRREGVRHLLVWEGGELVGYGQLEDTDPVEAPAGEFIRLVVAEALGVGDDELVAAPIDVRQAAGV